MWAKQPTLPKTPLARKAIATSGWSTENALRGVIARFCMTKKRRAADDLLVLEDQEQDRPEDPCQKAEVLDPIRTRCVIARLRRGLRLAMVKDSTQPKRNQNIPIRVPTARKPKRPLASIMRKTALASLETSVATLTRRTERPFLHDLMKIQKKRALVKNPMLKAPAAWPFQSAATIG